MLGASQLNARVSMTERLTELPSIPSREFANGVGATVFELVARQPEIVPTLGGEDDEPAPTFRQTGIITQPQKEGDPMDMDSDFTED